MHHKFMVVYNFNPTSDPLVLLGSHNWSSAAQTKNDENTLSVHDANIANQYYQAFAYLYLQLNDEYELQSLKYSDNTFSNE
jgi:phosphatidylserine/phosphatidylglycerophosphate/cardiolipin synthase-like enzyme